MIIIDNIQDERIAETINSVFVNAFSIGTPTPNCLITKDTSVYRVIGRVTGNGQLNDILMCGYVRAKKTSPEHRNHNRLFWTKGGKNTFYRSGNSMILEAPSAKVLDGQIGAIPFNDLIGIWQFNPEKNAYENRIAFYQKVYEEVHQNEEHKSR